MINLRHHAPGGGFGRHGNIKSYVFDSGYAWITWYAHSVQHSAAAGINAVAFRGVERQLSALGCCNSDSLLGKTV